MVDSVVSEHLQTLFEWQPALFNALCNKALAAQAASVAAKAAREMVRMLLSIVCFLYVLEFIAFFVPVHFILSTTA